MQLDSASGAEALNDLDFHILLALMEHERGTGELATWLGSDVETVGLRLKRLRVMCLVMQRTPPLWACTSLGVQAREGMTPR